MACSRPVLATLVGGIPEAVNDGETGRLVPVANARALSELMLAMLRDKGLREMMGRKGRAKVESVFTWSQNARTAIAAYERVVSP